MAKATAKKNSAFMKPVQPSEHLAKIVGTAPLPRTEITKKIWAHIKKHKLQNPKNKREILADDCAPGNGRTNQRQEPRLQRP